MTLFTVLVCGGRNYNDHDKVYNVLYDLCDKKGLWSEPDSYGNKLPLGIKIVNGKASGADLWSSQWAVMNWVPLKEYPPEYDKYPGYSAPLIRNQQMIDEETIDLVIAFPGGPGTADMCRRARKAGIPVQEVK